VGQGQSGQAIKLFQITISGPSPCRHR